jgi:hypothetical protein
MSYSIQGKVIDTDKNPIPFALVYTSDASGKPVTPSKNTLTDDKGFWKLNDLNDTDVITIRNVGYKMQTFSAKNVPNVSLNEFMPPQRSVVTTLPNDFNTEEVQIVAEKVIPKKEDAKNVIPKKKIPKKKNPYPLIIIGGLFIIATAIILYKKSKK